MLRALSPLFAPYQGLASLTVRAVTMCIGVSPRRKLSHSFRLPVDTFARCVDKPVKDPSPPSFPDLVLGSPTEEWSKYDGWALQEALALPLDRDKLFEDFAQTSEGNCAMVATLKAAMRKFGRRLFRKVEKEPRGGWQVLLRDGSEVHVDPHDLALTKGHAKLKGKTSATRSFAIFSYAVAAARHAQLMPAVDLETGLMGEWLSYRERKEKALLALSDGHNPRSCATYLGVGSELRRRDFSAEDDHWDDSSVVTSGNHATYVQRVKGEVKADHYGQDVLYDGTDTNGRPVLQRYTFEGPGTQEIDGWFFV